MPDVPAGVSGRGPAAYGAAIDVLVPAHTSRARQNGRVGPDLVTTAPGAARAQIAWFCTSCTSGLGDLALRHAAKSLLLAKYRGSDDPDRLLASLHQRYREALGAPRDSLTSALVTAAAGPARD